MVWRRCVMTIRQHDDQQYRPLVARSIAQALATAEQLDEVSPAVVRREKSTWSSNRFRTAPLGESIEWKQRTRIERTGWNYFKSS
jgi:hypothetical protein